MAKKETTPLRKQYLDLKAQYPDTILFFRLGDFYETFDEDAETAARELDLVLTSRPVAKGNARADGGRAAPRHRGLHRPPDRDAATASPSPNRWANPPGAGRWSAASSASSPPAPSPNR